jgi:hypothetical protein
MPNDSNLTLMGAFAGFLIGVLAIVLAAFDSSVNGPANLPILGTSLASIELRLLILAACTAAGFVFGLRLGQFFSMESPGAGRGGAQAQYAIGQGAGDKHCECDEHARAHE